MESVLQSITKRSRTESFSLVVTGGYFGGFSKAGGDETVNVNEEHNALSDETADVKDGYSVAGHNLFVITAHAAELPKEVSSGDVVGLSAVVARVGSSEYLDGRFVISGQNIEKVKIVTDKCNLYSAISIYEGDAEFLILTSMH